MTKKPTRLAGAIALGLLTATTSFSPVKAADVDPLASLDWAGSFVVRGRVLGVLPSDKQRFTPAVNTSVSNTIIPELDVAYFLTDNIAIETIAGVTWHTLRVKNGPKIGTTVFIPATITAQYHFHLGDKFKPYIGAGPHMSLILSDKAKAPFTSFKLKNPRFGVALQAGFDYMVDSNWMVNFDVKKVFVSLKGNVNNGAVLGKAKINPWIVGGGVGYKF